MNDNDNDKEKEWSGYRIFVVYGAVFLAGIAIAAVIRWLLR